MPNVKITELPQINFSSITDNDVIPIVNVTSNETSKVLTSDLKTFFSTPFTGGTISVFTEFTDGVNSNIISATTISGDTFYGDGSNLTNLPTFTGGTISGLTATTVSATTYENLPETIPYYANSLWTSFQNSVRVTNSTNFGSNTSIGVGFNIPNSTRIKSAKLEISAFAGACDGYLSIHKVENGIITERLWQEQYNIVGTGIYTFTGITLDLVSGNYAYATNQTIIQGYRSINLENDNIFGLIPTLGTSPYITGKLAGIVNVIPDPYPISQVDYFGSVPLVIFEIELI